MSRHPEAPDDSCRFCLAEADSAACSELGMFQNADWALDLDDRGIPGWFLLRSRRHVEGFESLSETESGSFGPTLTLTLGAIRSSYPCGPIYLVSFGETFPHFHMLLSARPRELDPARSKAQFLIDPAAFVDHQLAKQISLEVQRLLAAEPET